MSVAIHARGHQGRSPARAARGAQVLVVFVAAMSVACQDRLLGDQIAALGGEQPGVARDRDHRPGQPCVLCHQEGGPAESPFSLAGTIYRDNDLPAAGEAPTVLAPAQVLFIDSQRQTFQVTTSCSGNFFVRKGEFDPVFPVWASVRYPVDTGDVRDMESPIRRERSCAVCHQDPPGPTSAEHVYLTNDPSAELPMGCQMVRAPGGGP